MKQPINIILDDLDNDKIQRPDSDTIQVLNYFYAEDQIVSVSVSIIVTLPMNVFDVSQSYFDARDNEILVRREVPLSGDFQSIPAFFEQFTTWVSQDLDLTNANILRLTYDANIAKISNTLKIYYERQIVNGVPQPPLQPQHRYRIRTDNIYLARILGAEPGVLYEAEDQAPEAQQPDYVIVFPKSAFVQVAKFMCIYCNQASPIIFEKTYKKQVLKTPFQQVMQGTTQQIQIPTFELPLSQIINGLSFRFEDELGAPFKFTQPFYAQVVIGQAESIVQRAMQTQRARESVYQKEMAEGLRNAVNFIAQNLQGGGGGGGDDNEGGGGGDDNEGGGGGDDNDESGDGPPPAGDDNEDEDGSQGSGSGFPSPATSSTEPSGGDGSQGSGAGFPSPATSSTEPSGGEGGEGGKQVQIDLKEDKKKPLAQVLHEEKKKPQKQEEKQEVKQEVKKEKQEKQEKQQDKEENKDKEQQEDTDLSTISLVNRNVIRYQAKKPKGKKQKEENEKRIKTIKGINEEQEGSAIEISESHPLAKALNNKEGRAKNIKKVFEKEFGPRNDMQNQHKRDVDKRAQEIVNADPKIQYEKARIQALREVKEQDRQRRDNLVPQKLKKRVKQIENGYANVSAEDVRKEFIKKILQKEFGMKGGSYTREQEAFILALRRAMQENDQKKKNERKRGARDRGPQRADERSPDISDTEPSQ